MVEGGGSTGLALAGIAARIEPAAPEPRIRPGLIAVAKPDRADMHVPEIDQPSLLQGVRIAAAAEGGHVPLIPPIAREGKPLGSGPVRESGLPYSYGKLFPSIAVPNSSDTASVVGFDP